MANNTRQIILYLLRWQLSTPILALCLVFLDKLGAVPATIIANLIGGLIFYWVDKLIFRGGGNGDKKTNNKTS